MAVAKPPAGRRPARKTTPAARRPPKPFTLAHFVEWARGLTLDTGKPWVLERFQEAFLNDVFRGVPECWLVVPEGNGKTTLVAGLALYQCEMLESAMIPVAASSREQAEILYLQAEGFVLRSRRLRALLKCLPGYRRIETRRNRPSMMDENEALQGVSRIQVFAADDRTGDGIVPTLCIVDELHRHLNLRLYRTWRGKLEKRGGQIVTISTAGEPGSEFEVTRERIRQAATDVSRERTFLRAASPNLVLHEWAVPQGADVEDLELVNQANPFSGITVEKLHRKRNSPTMTDQHWRRFVCNQPTRSEQAAITEIEWHAAATTERIPPGEPVWLGLDIAWKWDTTAAVPLWLRPPTIGDGERAKEAILTDPIANPRAPLRENLRIRLFGPARVLTPPRDGSSMDPDKVEAMLTELHQQNPIHTVVMDMSKAEQLATWIERTLGATVIDRSQSNTAAVLDYDRFMEALREGWLRHSGDAELTKHALNAVSRMLPGGDVRFERPSQTREGGDQERRVIDALVAAAMVHTSAVAEFYMDEPEPMMAWA